MFSSSAVRRPRRIALSAVGALLAGLVLGIVPSTQAVAAPAPPAKAGVSSLQAGLDRMVAHGAPGALLYTYDHGHVTALQSGLADIEAERPMGPQDRYRIGSLTKTYVSTAVLQLVAQDRVDLDAPVSHYLPGLMGGAPRFTIRQLLGHTSGLYEFNDDPRVLAPYLDGDLGYVWSPRRLVRLALTHDLTSRPGTEYHYSNTNYLLAGLVVQAVTGHRLSDVLRDRVFAPAGLAATTFTPSRTLPAPAAHGYFVFPGDDQPRDITSLYPYPWASGAMVSTAPDVARFYRSLLEGELIPRRLLSAMKTTVDASAEEDPGTRYGLGLESFQTPCGTAWGHAGNFPGYITYAYSSADGRRQSVLLVNEDPSSLPRAVAPDFMGVLNQSFCG